MQIQEERLADIIILKPLTKRIDASVAPEFKAFMLERIGSGNTSLLLDFSMVDFIDSSGIGAIISILKTLGGKGSVSICCLSETVNTVFRLSRMDKIFHISASREDALKTLNINR